VLAEVDDVPPLWPDGWDEPPSTPAPRSLPQPDTVAVTTTTRRATMLRVTDRPRIDRSSVAKGAIPSANRRLDGRRRRDRPRYPCQCL